MVEFYVNEEYYEEPQEQTAKTLEDEISDFKKELKDMVTIGRKITGMYFDPELFLLWRLKK